MHSEACRGGHGRTYGGPADHGRAAMPIAGLLPVRYSFPDSTAAWTEPMPVQ